MLGNFHFFMRIADFSCLKGVEKTTPILFKIKNLYLLVVAFIFINSKKMKLGDF